MKLPSFLRRVQVDDNYNLVEVSVATRVRRVLTAVLVLIVNVFLIIRATVSCDIALSDTFLVSEIGGRDLAAAVFRVPKPSYLTPSARKKQPSAKLFRLLGQNTADEMGNLQIKNAQYVETANILQFTARQNLRHYPLEGGDGEKSLTYVVRVAHKHGITVYCEDETGAEFYKKNQALAYESLATEYYKASVHTVTDTHRGYAYTRFSYDELAIDRLEDYVVLYVYDTESGSTVLSTTLLTSSSSGARESFRSQTYLDV